MAERTSAKLVPHTTNSTANSHTCPNWPPNLLSCVDVTLRRVYRHFCAVEYHLGGLKKDALLLTPLSFISPLPPGSKLRIFGVWIFKERFLLPGSHTSWLHPSLRFSDVSISPNFGFLCRLLTALMVMFFFSLFTLTLSQLSTTYP